MLKLRKRGRTIGSVLLWNLRNGQPFRSVVSILVLGVVSSLAYLFGTDALIRGLENWEGLIPFFESGYLYTPLVAGLLVLLFLVRRIRKGGRIKFRPVRLLMQIVGVIFLFHFINLLIQMLLYSSIIAQLPKLPGLIPYADYIVGGFIALILLRILTFRIDSEKIDRRGRERKLDKKFGRLDSKKLQKIYGKDFDIPLARVGKLEQKLTANNCNDGLIGIDHQKQKGHVMVIAPTQSGKGLQLTTILENWKHSAVVIDPKGEQYARLSGLIDCVSIPAVSVPLAQLYGLNVLEWSPDVANNIRVLYQNLIRPDDGKGDSFWYRMGEPLLRACWKYAQQQTAQPDPIRLFFDMALSRPSEALPALYAVAPREVNQFTPTLEKLESNKMILSGWQTLVSRLSPYQDMLDVIAPVSSSGVIDTGFTQRQTAVFITFDFPTMQAQNGLVSAILGGITMHHQRHGNKAPLLMAIDELPTVAPVTLPIDLATLTSYGVRYLLYAQNIPQLVESYGVNGADDLLGNCKTRVFYSPNDPQTAKVMSQMGGQGIRLSDSYSDRREQDEFVTTNTSRGERVESALNPDEALKLAQDQVLLQLDGGHIATGQRVWIVPKLIAGEYRETAPPQRNWSQRHRWEWGNVPLPPPTTEGSNRRKESDNDFI